MERDLLVCRCLTGVRGPPRCVCAAARLMGQGTGYRQPKFLIVKKEADYGRGDKLL